jgi:hypothetical protein
MGTPAFVVLKRTELSPVNARLDWQFHGGRQQPAAEQGASKLAHSKGAVDPANIRDYALLDISYNPISVSKRHEL